VYAYEGVYVYVYEGVYVCWRAECISNDGLNEGFHFANF